MEVMLIKPLHSEEYDYSLPKGQQLPVVEQVEKGVIVLLPNVLQVLLPESYYAH